MSTITTYGIAKWFEDIPCPRRLVNFIREDFPQIEVESPELTASYYKEYLGFKAFKKSIISEGEYFILNGNNIIKLISKENSNTKKSKTNNNQYFNIYSKDIESDYQILKEKTWILEPLSLSKDGEKTFTIKDCNGINLVYTSKSN
ncbi:MAG: VOC family protein [Tenuifilaceae bacterium]